MFGRKKHTKECKEPEVRILSKTYRGYKKDKYDGDLYEVTEFLLVCDNCGNTWKETLNGKEVKEN
jgi:hypothetical protein